MTPRLMYMVAIPLLVLLLIPIISHAEEAEGGVEGGADRDPQLLLESKIQGLLETYDSHISVADWKEVLRILDTYETFPELENYKREIRHHIENYPNPAPLSLATFAKAVNEDMDEPPEFDLFDTGERSEVDENNIKLTQLPELGPDTTALDQFIYEYVIQKYVNEEPELITVEEEKNYIEFIEEYFDSDEFKEAIKIQNEKPVLSKTENFQATRDHIEELINSLENHKQRPLSSSDYIKLDKIREGLLQISKDFVIESIRDEIWNEFQMQGTGTYIPAPTPKETYDELNSVLEKMNNVNPLLPIPYVSPPNTFPNGLLEHIDPFGGTAHPEGFGTDSYYDLPNEPGIDLTPQDDTELFGIEPSDLTPIAPPDIKPPHDSDKVWNDWLDEKVKEYEEFFNPTTPTPTPTPPPPAATPTPDFHNQSFDRLLDDDDPLWDLWWDNMIENDFRFYIAPPDPPDYIPEDTPTPPQPEPKNQPADNTPDERSSIDDDIPKCCDEELPTPEQQEIKIIEPCAFCPPDFPGTVPSPLSWGTVTNTQVWPDQCNLWVNNGLDHKLWMLNAYLDETVCMNIKKSGGYSLAIDYDQDGIMDGCDELLCNFYAVEYETVYDVLSGTQFDSNQDGWFGPGDYKWKYAKAWDHDTGKLLTMDSLFIRAFNLSHAVDLHDDYTDYAAWQDPAYNGVGQYSDCAYEEDWAYERAISQGWECIAVDPESHERIVAYNPYGVLYETGGFKQSRDYVIGYWTPEQVEESVK